jgi:spore coat protein U-like protein
MPDVLRPRRIGTSFALALFGAAVAAVPAQAESMAESRGNGAPGSRSISFDVIGTISQRCTLGRIDDINLGDLSVRAADREIRVALDCNVPFTIAVRAANGAIAHTRLPGGQGPYAGRIPFALALNFAVRKPVADTVVQTFQGQNLVGGQSVSSRGGIASDGMRMTLSLGEAGGDAGLLAGTYTETIEITVAPE